MLDFQKNSVSAGREVIVIASHRYAAGVVRAFCPAYPSGLQTRSAD